MPIPEVLERIRRGKNFLITSHMNLEGDALGSEIAVSYLLRKMKKKCFICNSSPIPRIYNFMPSLNIVQTADRKIKNFDTAIVLDCSDLERTGKVKDFVTKSGSIINIDHHVDNKKFGDVNWVKPEASSVGEMIYELFKKAKISLNKDIALCLYAAILTDTGSFRYRNTSSATHMITGHLLEYGIRPEEVFKKIYESHKLSRMKLLGIVLGGLMVEKGVAWITVSDDMLKKTRSSLDDVEGFIEMAASIEGIKVAVLFQEIEREKIKIGFRSRGNVNVCKIAAYFGGGGHFAASGCILRENLKTAQREVLSKIRKYLGR